MTFLIILAFVILGLGLICMLMQNKYIEAYHGVFGKVSAVLFADGGLAGIGAIVYWILSIVGLVDGEDPVIMLISGVVCLAIAALAFYFASRKVDGNKAALIWPMFVVGMGTLVWLSFKTVGLMFKMIFNMSNSGGGSGNFAEWYVRESDGAQCRLVVDNETYAILKDRDTNEEFEVTPEAGGYVYDRAGNRYRPD